MKARELTQEVLKRMEAFNVNTMMPALRMCNEGSVQDVRNTNGCAYYQWTPCMIDMLKPKQVVELGGAMGVWALCVLHALPQASHLYSITLEEQGKEFSFIADNYPNLTKIVGTDLDMDNWKGVDLKETDVWFFDAEHTPEHLTKELDLYSPFFKEGAVILIDDVRSFGLTPVWEQFMNGKWGEMDAYEATSPLHYSGYGVSIKL